MYIRCARFLALQGRRRRTPRKRPLGPHWRRTPRRRPIGLRWKRRPLPLMSKAHRPIVPRYLISPDLQLLSAPSSKKHFHKFLLAREPTTQGSVRVRVRATRMQRDSWKMQQPLQCFSDLLGSALRTAVARIVRPTQALLTSSPLPWQTNKRKNWGNQTWPGFTALSLVNLLQMANLFVPGLSLQVMNRNLPGRIKKKHTYVEFTKVCFT